MISAILLSPFFAAPQEEFDPLAAMAPKPQVTVAIRADRKDVKPGETFNVIVEADVPPTTYFYSDKPSPDGLGIPVSVKAKAAEGVVVGKPAYPPPKTKQTTEGVAFIYDADVKLPLPVTAPKDAKVGSVIEVEASCRFQYCDASQCYAPKTVTTKISLPVVAAATNDAERKVERIDSVAAADARQKEWPSDLPLKLGLAFLAGLVLNVMPCVLPVIAIKVLSFVQHAGHSRKKLITANLTYSLGVLTVFWILAALAITIGMNWGQQFQSRWFTMLMAWGVFTLSLSLLGLFEIPLPGFIGSLGSHRQEGPLGVFMSGAASTLLATPCVGPFLGPLLAWTFAQPPAVSFLTWSMVGVGMASPYLVFAIVPGAVKLLPKPGVWMVTFKQVCGFVMLATAVFLLNSFKEKEAIIRGLFLFVATGFYFWLTGSRINVLTPASKAWATRGMAAVGVAAFLMVPEVIFPKKLLPWTPFTEARLMELVKEGKPILIDFTAEWCVNCRVNERVAIEKPAVLEAVKKHGIQPLYADWTDESKEIEKWLAKFGSTAIPLTVVISPGDLERRKALDGLFTEATLLSAIEETIAAKPKPEEIAQQ